MRSLFASFINSAVFVHSYFAKYISSSDLCYCLKKKITCVITSLSGAVEILLSMFCTIESMVIWDPIPPLLIKVSQISFRTKYCALGSQSTRLDNPFML